MVQLAILFQCTAFIATVMSASLPIQAASSMQTATNSQSHESIVAYWTAERIQAASPAPIANSAGGASYNTSFGADAASGAASGAPQQTVAGGQLPSLSNEEIANLQLPSQLFTPGPQAPQAQPGAATGQGDPEGAVGVSPGGAFYSSSRIIPLSADTSFPYRTIGKLYFTALQGSGASPGNYVCSAAVVARRLVLTGGHCVHSGLNGQAGFFTNFMFVPAFRDGSAPFGQWSSSYTYVTNAWYSGRGIVPNAADYAILIMSDRSGVNIGSTTGWLGVGTFSLLPNHVKIVGYPCNIDNCQKMHQVDAASYARGASNTALYGSDMRQGSSGGPWIMNFGAPGSGQPRDSSVAQTPFNIIIGVTSFGATATGPKFQGSSIFDWRVISLYNSACQRTTGNC